MAHEQGGFLITILIVDDKKSMVDVLKRSFAGAGYSVLTAHTVKDAMERLRSAAELDGVVTDLKLPDGDGLQILAASKERSPLMPIVVMTAHGTIENAVGAVKQGAYDFIAKPFDPDHLLLLVARALSESGSRRENIVLKKEFSRYLRMPELIGESPQWQSVVESARKVASLKTTALILGESGTGKELIARAIHFFGQRAGQPFVAVNCAAIPKDLIENELFGHEKGAFTGATEIKPGRFELADKGTIFLDEIGDMDLSLQAKLLRVLQESEFERVGGTRALRVDVRIVAASNKDLHKAVAEGTFREDLFYRLNVFPLFILPLRERRADILPLAKHFVQLHCREMNRRELVIDNDAAQALEAYGWKGNVRELKNVLERAVIMTEGFRIERCRLALCPPESPALPVAEGSLLAVGDAASRAAEKALIEQVLRETGGNKSRAAEKLQVSYKTLLTKIKDYGLENLV
ncbi:MAG TPA: sigma-54 dependent transcriptional regulator [Dissulfurispiraceae bacterium]|nr:sigma-54 dependent transcriptional regulator [Dissulfurispiraceae bacterium]